MVWVLSLSTAQPNNAQFAHDLSWLSAYSDAQRIGLNDSVSFWLFDKMKSAFLGKLLLLGY